ncbi:MAG: transcription elongation factor Spt5 [Candidatus Nanohalarchaeota archaeon]|nr:MAG: transcription elongation factor Spt5 [Candidatus Nanohaloarchaeota archaeon]
MVIYTIRTTRGRERLIMENMYEKLKGKDNGIYAMFHPPSLRGYVFIEAKDKESILASIAHMPNIRGILHEEVALDKIEHYFAKKEEKIVFDQGDMVEIIRGPFKKEKAKIKTVNETKEEARVELVNSVVPIPITIKLSQLKQLESHND